MKHLYTVPEDGMGDKAWLSGANSIVREIMAKRPDEDLVICVAGCVAMDRVVYAQPAEKPMANAEAKDVMKPGFLPTAADAGRPEAVTEVPAQQEPAAHQSE